MKFVVHGRSRFTKAPLELEIEAASVLEAHRQARRLGLMAIRARQCDAQPHERQQQAEPGPGPGAVAGGGPGPESDETQRHGRNGGAEPRA